MKFRRGHGSGEYELTPEKKCTILYKSFDQDGVVQQHTRDFMHSGWNYSKRHGILVVENNATRNLVLKMHRHNIVRRDGKTLQVANDTNVASKGDISLDSAVVAKRRRNLTPLLQGASYAMTAVAVKGRERARNKNFSVNMNYSTIDTTTEPSVNNLRIVKAQKKSNESILNERFGPKRPADYRSISGNRYKHHHVVTKSIQLSKDNIGLDQTAKYSNAYGDDV